MTNSETIFTSFFSEPLNAIASSLFLFIVVYWVLKIKEDYRFYGFLSYVLALFFIGGIGVISYHSMQHLPFYVVIDWLPILFLSVSTGIYFILRLTNWICLFFALLGYGLIVFYLQIEFEDSNRNSLMNINYALMGMLFLIPLVAYLVKTDWRKGKWIGFAIISFVFGLLFRMGDDYELLDTKTHFLWHIFSFISCFFILNYIYLVRGKYIKSTPNDLAVEGE